MGRPFIVYEDSTDSSEDVFPDLEPLLPVPVPQHSSHSWTWPLGYRGSGIPFGTRQVGGVSSTLASGRPLGYVPRAADSTLAERVVALYRDFGHPRQAARGFVPHVLEVVDTEGNGSTGGIDRIRVIVLPTDFPIPGCLTVCVEVPNGAVHDQTTLDIVVGGACNYDAISIHFGGRSDVPAQTLQGEMVRTAPLEGSRVGTAPVRGISNISHRTDGGVVMHDGRVANLGEITFGATVWSGIRQAGDGYTVLCAQTLVNITPGHS